MEEVKRTSLYSAEIAPLVDEARLRARVAKAVAAGGGVAEMERKSGIPRGTLEKYAAQTSTPSLLNAVRIAISSGISLDEIVTASDGASNFGAKTGLRALLDHISSGPNDGWKRQVQSTASHLVQLPKYDVHASAGLGLPVGSEVQLGAIAFDRQFLRERGAAPEQCSIISASGDSMQPSIPDGSLLVVDHSQIEVKNGHIMVINVGEDLLVKRIRRRLDGLIDLISDNPAYPPETLGPDTLQQLRVVGRVVYFCRVP